MTNGQENCASRRALLKGAPALAVIAAVAAETGIALAAASDPWVSLGAAYFHHRDACDDALDDKEGDRHYSALGAACDRLEATRPTTTAGVVAGLRVASADLYQFHIENHDQPCPGHLFLKAIMDNACAALERGVAHV